VQFPFSGEWCDSQANNGDRLDDEGREILQAVLGAGADRFAVVAGAVAARYADEPQGLEAGALEEAGQVLALRAGLGPAGLRGHQPGTARQPGGDAVTPEEVLRIMEEVMLPAG